MSHSKARLWLIVFLITTLLFVWWQVETLVSAGADRVFVGILMKLSRGGIRMILFGLPLLICNFVRAQKKFVGSLLEIIKQTAKQKAIRKRLLQILRFLILVLLCGRY